ncbi:XamI family restriction endonuclease [Pseudomonas aeruginosa]|uniref:XamI family restriction endonuclease n=1 Tax=Pseudomonas koreensis TaxID=198620 RepID=UPI0018E67EE6|nr:XamI family restriction endonuclease [Pseudomonas koreensis]MBI6949128.1 XamI family restriction endonuclease [Pseudomonas koreensis]MDR9465648.1 XamI family restriction endonuclease [Pseudomonas aeruginosa]MDR9475694.1 XamI family restriction endonuclease [Pseudomonas aeruginosa]
MTSSPARWTTEELIEDAAISAAEFRTERLAVSGAWESHYQAARKKFELLFQKLSDLNPGGITDAKLTDVYGSGLGEALRYLAGPPISDDDLQVIADVDSIAPGVLKKKPGEVRKVFEVIERVIDLHRFPWIEAGTIPTDQERDAALLASSVLLAAQRIATERRIEGKDGQETRVKDYLRTLGFTEVSPATITTIVKGPQPMQFCAECLLGERKADVVVRLHDTRLMAIECKVSNSATNSVKRLNNDAAVKAEYWLKMFGTSQVVPAAMLSGVFKVMNLEQAQQRGLAMFWAHDLDKLGAFIESTKQ